MTSALPPLLANKYRPLRELGRGGMGAVYLVEHINTGERFALKVLLGDHQANAQVVERFKMEARASARIGSENVVRMIDADTAPEIGGALYLVMELLDGADLDKLVLQRGPLPPAHVVAALTQTARALDRAHGAGIIHRDLKPENLFLHRREDGTSLVKILDFGISKFLTAPEQGAKSLGLTKAGSMLGTPLYMAPEQIGAGNITAQTDVWALGLIAFQLLTGKSYWRTAHRADGTVMGLIAEITVEAPEAASSRAHGLGAAIALPAAFDAWFARCVHREPSARFGSAGTAAQALRAALGVGAEALVDLGALLASEPLVPSSSAALDDTLAPIDGSPRPLSSAPTVAESLASHAITTPAAVTSLADSSGATQLASHRLGASTGTGVSMGQSAHLASSAAAVPPRGIPSVWRNGGLVVVGVGLLCLGLWLGRREAPLAPVTATPASSGGLAASLSLPVPAPLASPALAAVASASAAAPASFPSTGPRGDARAKPPALPKTAAKNGDASPPVSPYEGR